MMMIIIINVLKTGQHSTSISLRYTNISDPMFKTCEFTNIHFVVVR